jgi:hypothetical protein
LEHRHLPPPGPSLAISDDGAYHVTWFTNGNVRKGLFYARSVDGGATFSNPIPFGAPNKRPTNPYVIVAKNALWLAWKEFDGQKTTVLTMASRDHGQSWSVPQVVAQTAQSSDHPLLVASGQRVFLSWVTQAEGYQLISLE